MLVQDEGFVGSTALQRLDIIHRRDASARHRGDRRRRGGGAHEAGGDDGLANVSVGAEDQVHGFIVVLDHLGI